MLNKRIFYILVICIISVLAIASYASTNWFKAGDGEYRSLNSDRSSDIMIKRDYGEGKSLTTNKPAGLQEYTVDIGPEGSPWPLTIKYTIEDNQKKLLGVMEDSGGLCHLLSKNQDKMLFSYGMGIWMIDAEGNLQKLTSDVVNNITLSEALEINHNINWASHPIFTDDEEYIIYRSNLSHNGIGPKMNLWVMKNDGSENKLLFEPVNNHLEIVDWLGESELLLRSNDEISVLNITTGTNETILKDISPISLSPNKKILTGLKTSENFVDTTRVYSFNFATSELNVLSAHREGFNYTAFKAWSPDSQKFAYLVENGLLDQIYMRVVFFDEDGLELSAKEIEINKEPFRFSGARSFVWLNNDEILIELANLGEKIREYQTWTVKVTD